MIAVFKQQVEALKILLKRGADVNAVDSQDRQTALIAAISANCFDVAALLIEYGAAIYCPDKYKSTPFQYAKELGLTKIVALMMHYSDLTGENTLMHDEL